jgi:hypothetical protein
VECAPRMWGHRAYWRWDVRRALRMACDGVHVVAKGFLENSGSRYDDTHPAHTFVRLMRRMSAEAKQGQSVIAAVLAQHRTGSQWLRDLVGWTVASQVHVVHEHAAV